MDFAHWLDRRTLLAALMSCIGTAAFGAESRRMTVREVVRLIFSTPPPARANLSALDLSDLDLSEIDFKRSILRSTNLFGADLSSSNLEGADLFGARLDRTVIVRTNFTGAQMQECSLLRPSSFSSLSRDLREAPVFRNANLSGARILAQLDRADFRDANLTDAKLSWAPYMHRRSAWGTGLNGSNFDGAVAVRTSFAELSMKHASLRNANLQHTDFRDTNLSGADLSDADVSHADFTGANLSDAVLDGVRGRDLAVGL